ncbi:MAG: efflux RND transporter permease subunit, partial [Candidatus Hydrogenedentota bacterium]
SESRPLGITQGDLARQVYAGFYGLEADRIQRGRDDIRIKVRYDADERSSLAQLKNLRIRTPSGSEVPFFSVAEASYGAGPAAIDRADGRRRIVVTADVDEARGNATEILNELQRDFFPHLREKYSGFTISLEGSRQSSNESIGGLIALFPIAMLAIFIIIATLFRSYAQPMIVMITVPFGLMGAILGHVILGWQVVMFSIFGMMALTGVVVNDAIVLIEAINVQVAKGNKLFDAIVLGAARRFRAIMLTTISTIGALIPIIIETDLSAQPLNPMALSLACGVGLASGLTLIFIPSLFAILSDLRCAAHFMIKGNWPAREDVEPARHRNKDIFSA